MTYKRVVEKGGKKYSYYYQSYRQGDKVKKIYIGNKDDYKKWLEKQEGVSASKESRTTNFSNFKLFYIPLIILMLFGAFFLVYNLFPSNISGKVSLDIKNSYNAGEIVAGNLKMNLKYGELIPSDSKIVIETSGFTRKVLLSEILQPNANGNFYVENANLSGSGGGYGFAGKKVVYPEINFMFNVVKSGENVGEGNGSIGGVIVEKNETETQIPVLNESGTAIEQPAEITSPSTETPAETPARPPEENKDAGKKETKGEETQGKKEEKSQQPAESTITGQAIKEDEIEGKVSKDNPFSYDVKNKEDIEIISVDKGKISDLNKEVSDGKVTITTDYSETEEGFGQDYLESETKITEILLDSLNISAVNGILKVSLVYQDSVLASVSEDMSVAGVYQIINETLNQTLSENLNETMNTSLRSMRQIPDLEIKMNSNYTLNLSNYFNSAESYDAYAENISLKLDGSELLIEPDENFTGTRTGKVSAYSGNEILSQNFSILVVDKLAGVTVETRSYSVIINLPVKWQKKVSGNLSEYNLDLPKDAVNISIKTGNEIQQAEKTAEEEDKILGENKTSLITGQVSLNINFKGKNSGLITRFWSWLRGGKTTGNVVGEISEFQVTETETNKVVSVGDAVISENVTKALVEYYTPGPISNESETESGKEVVISAPDELNYTDILAYTELDNRVSVNEAYKIKLIWKNEGKEVKFDYYDLDEDGNIDYIEWNVLHLSSQTYILTIEQVFTGAVINNVTVETGKANYSHFTVNQSNLIGYWSFDADAVNTALTTAFDLSSNNRDGTLVGNVVMNSSSGKYGNGAYFDGSGDYITTGTSAGLAPGNFTISAWVYLDSDAFSAATDRIVFTSNTAGVFTNDGWYVGVNNGGAGGTLRTYLYVYNKGYQSKDGFMSTGGWFHFVGVKNGTSAKLYINGVESSSYSGTGILETPGTGGTKAIGTYDGTNYGWKGKLDEVVILNRTLNSSEILEVYNNQSERFFKLGTQMINNTNISGDGTENRLNISTNCLTQYGTNISFKLNNNPAVNLTNCNITDYAFTDNPNSVNLTFTFQSDPYVFYTPYIIGNFSVTSWNVSVEVSDAEYPQFSNFLNYPGNNTQYTPDANYWFNITITSTNGTAGISLNGINYSMTNTTEYFNKTLSELQAGAYPYYFFSWGNGTSHLYNISNPYSYTIASNNTLALGLTAATPITYGTSTNFGGICISQLSCNLNVSNQIFGAGFVSANYSTAGNANYTATSKEFTVTINKAMPLGNLTNTTSMSVTYPLQVNVSLYELNNGDADVTYNISLNGVNITNKGQNITLAAGNYNYTLMTTGGQNWSSNMSMMNFTINIAQGTGIINGTINGTQGNFTSINGTGTQNIYLNATNMTGDGTGKIYLNGSIINSGTLPLYNVTNLSIGFYNVTFEYDGNENYTGYNDTWWVNVTAAVDVEYPLFYNYTSNNATLTGSGIATFSVNINMTNGTAGIQFNGTNYSLSNITNWFNASISVVNGTYEYYYWAFGNGTSYNYNKTSVFYYTVNDSETTFPTMNTTYPINGTNYTNYVTMLNYTIVEANPGVCWYSNNSGVTNSTNISAGTNWTYINGVSVKGYNNWTLWCNDTSGNTNSTTSRFYVDDINPTINISSPTNTSYTSSIVLVNVSSSEDGTGMIVPNLDNSLVSWWRMDDVNSSGDVVDYLGRNNGTRVNAVQTDSGKFGKAFAFDGSGDYLNMGGAISAINYSTPYSMSVWVKIKEISSTDSWIASQVRGTNDKFAVSSSGIGGGGSTFKVRFGHYNGTSYNSVQSSFIGYNALYHIAIINYANQSKLIYVNGILDSSAASGVSPGFLASNFYIGTNGFGTNSLNGSIDEVMIFNRTLSEDEIVALYNATRISHNETLADGSHTFTGYTQDLAANIALDNVTWYIDATPPIVNATYPQNISYNVNVSALNYTLIEANPSACWWTNDSGLTNSTGVVAGTNWTDLTSLGGSNTWTVYCNDTSNNVDSSSVTFYKDNVPPYFITIANQSINYSLGFNYTINASDDVAFACFSVNDSRFAINCSGYLKNDTLLGVALYWLNITINDTFENQNSTLMWVNVTQILGLMNGTINGTQGNFTSINGTGTQNIYLNATNMTGDGTGKIYLNGSIINSGTLPLYNVTNLSIGFYNVTFEYDGNENYTGYNDTWWVNVTQDLAAPVVNLISPDNAYSTTTQTLSLVYNVSDDSTISNCSLNINGVTDQNDGSITRDMSQSFLKTFSAGTYSWSINCTDYVGNMGNSSIRSLTITQSTLVTSSGGGGGGGAIQEESRPGFTVDKDLVSISTKQGESVNSLLKIKNIRKTAGDFEISLSPSLYGKIMILEDKFRLNPGEEKNVSFTFISTGDGPVGVYTGTIFVKFGQSNISVPVVFEVRSKKSLFDVKLEIPARYKIVVPGEDLLLQISIFNLGEVGRVDAFLNYSIKDFDGNVVAYQNEMVAVETQASFSRNIALPKDLNPGKYVAVAEVSYGGAVATSSAIFNVINSKVIHLTDLIVMGISFLVLALLFFTLRKRKDNWRQRFLIEQSLKM